MTRKEYDRLAASLGRSLQGVDMQTATRILDRFCKEMDSSSNNFNRDKFIEAVQFWWLPS